MRINTLLRLLPLFFLSSLSVFANETPYKLTVADIYGITPVEACSQFPLSSVDDRTIVGYRASVHSYNNSYDGQTCSYKFKRSSGEPYSNIYNGFTGGIPITFQKLQPCDSGTTKTVSVPIGRDNSGNYQDFGSYYASNQCFSGCNAIYIGGDGSNEAYTKPEDTDTLVYENLVYELTGSSCNASSSDPLFTPPAPPAPEPDPEDPDEPIDPIDPANPGGGTDGGGGSGGGSGSGGGETGGGGDTGGGDTGGGDTGGGGGGGGGADCTGDNSCNSNGDGDGDSEDRGDVSGLACDQSFTCTGDVIQCGVLKLQRDQACAWKLGDDELGAIQDIQSGEDYELREETLEVSGLFTEALNKGRWLPQSCPAPESISIMGKVYEISYEPLCRFALALGPVLVAMASLFFAVYVGRGLKGN